MIDFHSIFGVDKSPVPQFLSEEPKTMNTTTLNVKTAPATNVVSLALMTKDESYSKTEKSLRDIMTNLNNDVDGIKAGLVTIDENLKELEIQRQNLMSQQAKLNIDLSDVSKAQDSLSKSLNELFGHVNEVKVEPSPTN
jgi:chromosome segregation ATPase